MVYPLWKRGTESYGPETNRKRTVREKIEAAGKRENTVAKKWP